ncbi:MAG: hypothetical protein ACUZ9M_00885 [Candidatus Scalindua sp.]
MEDFNLSLLEKLTDSGPRLPWIKRWLIDEIWNPLRYKTHSHIEYLRQGEEAVNKFETLIASSADRVYEELLTPPETTKSLLNVLSDSKTAVVVFDGLSLREIPIIVKLSKDSGFCIKEISCSHAAIPCETIDFIERELKCPRIGPSQLVGRKELSDRGITAIYTENPIQGLGNTRENTSLLVWSAFPDNTYKDSGAKFDNHFENIHMQFETAWTNTVQQIKGKNRIVITSDHGYVFFGTGMDFLRSSQETKKLNDYFGNDRYVRLSERPDPPISDDIMIDTNRQIALIKGRIKTRSTGEAATRLYKHGGLSLMEMLIPWIVLEV